MRNCLCRWHIRLPMTRRLLAARHKCESLRRNFHFDSFTARKGGRRAGHNLPPLSLPPSLSKVGNGINLRHTRRPRCRSAVVILGQSITTSRVFPLKKKIALFRRVSSLPRQSPSDEKERDWDTCQESIWRCVRRYFCIGGVISASPIGKTERGSFGRSVRGAIIGLVRRSLQVADRVFPPRIFLLLLTHSLTAPPPPSSICCRCRRPLILNMRARMSASDGCRTK